MVRLCLDLAHEVPLDTVGDGRGLVVAQPGSLNMMRSWVSQCQLSTTVDVVDARDQQPELNGMFAYVGGFCTGPSGIP